NCARHPPDIYSFPTRRSSDLRYQDDNRYYKTRYSIVFPESENSKMEVVSMDRLDVGSGEFLNPHHQARMEGDLTDEQQMMLDDRSEEHTSELQSRFELVCRLL